MSHSPVFEAGEKTHRDENFPVASWLISKKHRGAVLAFYRFARAADDVADHPRLSEAEKITLLDQFEATLLGASEAVAEALPLRAVLAERGLTSRHALDLLIAFRQDARKSRYKDWSDLLHYCAFSAAPVGRFVLDVHGESPATWPASDALCAVLQIINHLQDCKADYLRLNRVYIPQGALERCGSEETALGSDHADAKLRECLSGLVAQTQSLMREARLSVQIRQLRLAMEVAVIEQLALRLLALLQRRDPLSERVHLGTGEMMWIAARSALATVARRMFQRKAPYLTAQKV